jgi:exodeoxyribonuclease VII large subunit
VVSAIGHEPDTPILDLVADVRASTPTDAAKLTVPDVTEEIERITRLRERGRTVLGGWLAQQLHGLESIRARPSLADPTRGLADRASEVDELRDRARRCLGHHLDRSRGDLTHQLARVRSMSPLATLERGYSVLQDSDGHVITGIDQAKPDQELQVRVRDGRIHVVVRETSAEEKADE